MCGKLIIFEFADEVDFFIKSKGLKFLKREKIIILGIEVCARTRLSDLGLDCVSPLTLFGKKGHEQALEKSEQLTKTIRNILSIQDCFGLEQGYINAFVFYFRFLLHHSLYLLEIIHQAVGLVKPDKVLAPKESTYQSFDVNLSENDRYLGKLASKYCLEHHLTFESFETGGGKNNVTYKLRYWLVEWIKQLFFPINYFFYRHFIYGKKIILSLSQAYNIPLVMERFRMKKAVPVYLQSKDYRQDLASLFKKPFFWSFFSLPLFYNLSEQVAFDTKVRRAWEKVEEIIEKDDSCKFHQVHVIRLLKEHVENRILPYLKRVFAQTIVLDKILTKTPPTLVVAHHALGVGYHLGALCRNKKIPAALISHGSHVPLKNRFDKAEWTEHRRNLVDTQYEHFAVQTPWMQRHIDQNKVQSNTFCSGPLLFAKQYDSVQVKPRKEVLSGIQSKWLVLHAGTPKKSRSMRFYVYETVDEYIDNINSLIRAVSVLKDVHLVVRFRPFLPLSVENFAKFLIESDCYSIHPEGRFEDFLLNADLLVSYSSTTIEEALQNKIPVLQYDPQGKYCHIPCQTLSKGGKNELAPCYYVDDEKNLAWGLKWIIKEHLERQNLASSAWDDHIFSKKDVVNIEEYFSAQLQ